MTMAVNSTTPGFDPALTATQITGAENLALGLFGGLKINGTTTPPTIEYDPAQFGLGPASLNPASPKRYPPYLDQVNLSWRQEGGVKTGRFADGAGPANDTSIPEIVDRYPSAEMPILYARAKRGVAPITAAAPGTANNSVITFGFNGTTRVGTYTVEQFIGYTGSSIGAGKTIKSGEYVNATYQHPSHGLRDDVNIQTSTQNPPPSGKTYQYPYNAYAYFESPQMPNTARNKDSYILISAGRDRVYGTKDDIVSFGTVGE
jgi:hypothetical protein